MMTKFELETKLDKVYFERKEAEALVAWAGLFEDSSYDEYLEALRKEEAELERQLELLKAGE